jgi:FixJ family two-component response regulator
MPGMTGFELHDRLLEVGHAIPTILITAFPDDSDRVRALSDGIGYLAKPCDARTLLASIQSAMESGGVRQSR